MSPISTFDLVSVADLELDRKIKLESLQDFMEMAKENRKAQLAKMQETSRHYLTPTNTTG